MHKVTQFKTKLLIRAILYVIFFSTNDEMTSAVNQKNTRGPIFTCSWNSLGVTARRIWLRATAAVKELFIENMQMSPHIYIILYFT